MKPARTVAVGVCLVSLGVFAAAAEACSVPVFQYALESWDPDCYGVLIFHRGPIDAESQATADALTQARNDEESPANVDVRTVDVAQDMPPGIGQIWEAQGNPTLPWMVVLPPIRYGIDPTRSIHSVRPTPEEAQALTDSPLRRKIAEALRAGDAAVWVLIESGDRAADDAAAKILAAEVARAARTIEMPTPIDPYAYDDAAPYDDASSYDEPEAQPADGETAEEQAAAEPRNPTFSILRMGRSDPAERILLAMLENAEPAPVETKPAGPMALAVFGRGRVLPPLVGRGIQSDYILEMCDFISGACSCTIKMQCPGVDLLIATDWLAPPPIPAAPADLTPVAAGACCPAAGPGGSGGGLLRNIAVAAGVLALAALLAVLLVSRKTARS